MEINRSKPKDGLIWKNNNVSKQSQSKVAYFLPDPFYFEKINLSYTFSYCDVIKKLHHNTPLSALPLTDHAPHVQVLSSKKTIHWVMPPPFILAWGIWVYMGLLI